MLLDVSFRKHPGYSFEKQLEIRNKDGFKGEMEYLKPYSNIAINRAIDELSCPSIVDIGAFFQNQINDEIIKKIKRFKKVIWLYSDNIREILKRRKINDEMIEIYIQTLNHSLYKLLSTYKINVNEKTPDEIINIIRNIVTLIY